MREKLRKPVNSNSRRIIVMSVPVEWLKKINQEFRDAGIEPRKRPWEALSRYSTEFRISFTLSSSIATAIFEYFESQSKPGAHHIGCLYESIYFFDAEFWTVSIPTAYGTVRLDAVNSLQEMPETLKEELISTPKTAWDFVLYWADCIDYGMGISDLSKSNNLDPFGYQLLMAADQELRSAVSQLKEKRPDSRVLLTCRTATEIFLKAYIALKVGLTERQAKDIGHDLKKAFDLFLETSGYVEWAVLKSKLDVFPSIRERYNGQSRPSADLWNGFALAQSIGAVIVREKTGRNTIAQVLSSNNAMQDPPMSSKVYW